jgi:coproporphyrinogen III oxidase-like Fe-S oxidoreductase
MDQAKVKTARELRKLFFDNPNLDALLIEEKLTNKEVRQSLCELVNLDTPYHYSIEYNRVTIWNVKS